MCCIIYFLDVPNINGTWKNQLGSNVVFQQEGRTIFGKYCTAVSRRLLQRPHFDLIGNIGTGMPTSIGWVVTFHVGIVCPLSYKKKLSINVG